VTLGAKQELFAELAATLIQKAVTLGYAVRLGETYRSPEEAARLAQLGVGARNSCHTLKLAIDLNLFKNGEFLKNTADHAPLGAWWKAQHPLCRWGGDFAKRDGNHYSLTHDGRA
jgi:hypothetical protein